MGENARAAVRNERSGTMSPSRTPLRMRAVPELGSQVATPGGRAMATRFGRPSGWKCREKGIARRSLLRRAMKVIAGEGNPSHDGRGGYRSAGRREAKAERWNNGNALRNSEKNQARYAR
jgi:hypothetical protein